VTHHAGRDDTVVAIRVWWRQGLCADRHTVCALACIHRGNPLGRQRGAPAAPSMVHCVQLMTTPRKACGKDLGALGKSTGTVLRGRVLVGADVCCMVCTAVTLPLPTLALNSLSAEMTP
jgi:hypothetical protein